MSAAIFFKNVSKSFGKTKALIDLSFTVNEGIVAGLLGSNGAGKSTTLRICSTLLAADTGEVVFRQNEQTISKAAARRSIALMPQGSALDPALNVEDNLRFYCKLLGMKPATMKSEVERVVQLFEIQEFRQQSIYAISGGQFRRAQLARAFLGEPSYILLDEPTLGIDIQGKIALWKKIREIASEKKVSIIIASNDLTEIEKTCDEIAFINSGRLVFQGNTNALPNAGTPHLECRLKKPFDERSISPPKNLSLICKSEFELLVQPDGYHESLFTFLQQLSSSFGIVSITEQKPSLTELFDQYGGIKS